LTFLFRPTYQSENPQFKHAIQSLLKGCYDLDRQSKVGAEEPCPSMSWFKKKRSLRTSPILIADLLYQILVEENNPHAAPEVYRLPEAVHERFRQKVLLYREANVLLALLTSAKEDPLFEQPLQEYERNLFPKSPETPTGAAKLQAVRAAMQDLGVLIDAIAGEGAKLAWSRNWFATIGHDEMNAVTLGLFALFWAKLHIAALKSLKEMIIE
jgi:hypothetical protein